MEGKHYRLKWNNFHKNMLNEFESMQNSEELADVTLTCEGINLKAHKFILSACSPYFRTVFKENPCPHPIVILKDIYYVDLIAIINYMYHGEVMVSEDNLSTFLETAVILQVSGLADTKRPTNLKNKHRKEKPHFNPTDASPKRLKKSPQLQQEAGADLPQLSPPKNQCLEVEVKTEKTDNALHGEESMEESVENNNEELRSEKTDPPSILEAALELREKPCASILARSLMSNPTEKPGSFSISSDVPKAIFIPRKPPETDLEQQVRSSPESSSPSLHQAPIKVENEDLYEMIEITSPEDIRSYQQQHHHYQYVQQKTVDEAQPHHSSQCGNCPHCGMVYSNQSALKYHVRLMHSDLTNMFCCHLCPESFDYREGYKKHMADVHLMRN